MNVERLRAKAAGLNTCGITMHKDTIALVILLNIENTAKHKWGSNFQTAMHTIRHQYAYDAVHNTTSVVSILTKLAAVDQNRNMCNVPASTDIGPCSSANAVDANLLYINMLVDTNMDNDTTTYGDTYVTTSNSESSAEKSYCRGRPKDEKKDMSTKR